MKCWDKEADEFIKKIDQNKIHILNNNLDRIILSGITSLNDSNTLVNDIASHPMNTSCKAFGYNRNYKNTKDTNCNKTNQAWFGPKCK